MGAFKMLTDRTYRKERRPLGRPRRRWEDNIREDLIEIDVSTRNWVDLVQVRGYWRALVNVASNLRVP